MFDCPQPTDPPPIVPTKKVFCLFVFGFFFVFVFVFFLIFVKNHKYFSIKNQKLVKNHKYTYIYGKKSSGVWSLLFAIKSMNFEECSLKVQICALSKIMLTF